MTITLSTTVANMKVRRSFIAIQTWSFIDKSEHLAAEGLHCCLATVGPCQCWCHLHSLHPPIVPTHFSHYQAPALGTQGLTHSPAMAASHVQGGGACLPPCSLPSSLPLSTPLSPDSCPACPSVWCTLSCGEGGLKVLHSRASLMLF